jgi:hypothetical protein
VLGRIVEIKHATQSLLEDPGERQRIIERIHWVASEAVFDRTL